MFYQNNMEEQATEGINDILKRYYFNNKQGFQSLEKFYRTLRQEGVKVTKKQVQQWLKTQPAYEETTRPRKPAVFNTIWADFPGQNYQMDTMFMTNYVYAGFKYILLVIDVHSRYLGAFPMKDKKTANYVRAFREIIEDQFDGIWPKSLNCDNEYNTNTFRGFLDENGHSRQLFTSGSAV